MDSEFLESSLFVKEGTTRLLEPTGYQLLDDDAEMGSWSDDMHQKSSNSAQSNRWFFSSESFNHEEIASDELLLHELYSYYLMRGFYRFITYVKTFNRHSLTR